jgi:hypothetical protein
VESKTCTRCERTLPLEAFDRKRKDKPWLFSQCRDCRRAAASERKRRGKANPKPPAPIVEPFPADDFLRFRELTCAYRHHRTKRYVRATSNWFMRDVYKKLERSHRLTVVMPPAHNKTTLLVEYMTWRIMRDRDIRVTVIAKNENEAKKIVQAVEQRLSDVELYDYLSARLVEQGEAPLVNPLTTWFAGKPFRPTDRGVGSTWGAFSFRVEGRTGAEKDLTVEAKGVGGPVQGVRADLILLDDIQSPGQAVKNPSDSTDKLRWFKDVVLGRVSDSSHVAVLANFFAPDDFAHLLLEANPEFEVVKYPALIPAWLARGEPEPDTPSDEPLVPLWPEYWTEEALAMKRKETGEQTWWATWSQIEGSYESATFRREVLEAARDLSYALRTLPPAVTDVFVGVDPAIAQSGFCAVIAWGLNRKTKERYLLDVRNEPGMRNWDNVADLITDVARPFGEAGKLRSATVEWAGTQEALLNSDRLRRSLGSLGCKIIPYKTRTGTGARSEADSFDITTIGSLFDAGLVHLPYAGIATDREKVDVYITQLAQWRTDEHGRSLKSLRKDMVMATLFAESECYTLANRPDRPVVQRPNRPTTQWSRKKEKPDRRQLNWDGTPRGLQLPEPIP